MEDGESLQLAVVARGLLRGEKIVAKYGLVLQAVVREGRILVSDSLVDLGNKPLPVSLTDEIQKLCWFRAHDEEACAYTVLF